MTPADNALIYIFFAGVLMTLVWRYAGLAVSAGLSEEGPLMRWFKAVSAALIAGLVSRIIIFPPGVLADVDIVIRIGAFAAGVAVFYVTSRHMGAGVLAGVCALLAAQLAAG